MAWMRALRDQNDAADAARPLSNGLVGPATPVASPAADVRRYQLASAPAPTPAGDARAPASSAPPVAPKRALPTPPPKASKPARELPTPVSAAPPAPAGPRPSFRPNASPPAPPPVQSRAEPSRPVRVYEEASSSYVGGLARLRLDDAPAVSVTPTPPSIAVDAPPPSIAVDDPPPTFSISGPDPPPHVNVVPRSAPRSTSGPPSLVCAACEGLIAGKILNAMDRRWHPACFVCTRCSTGLEHVAYKAHAGAAYCALCYDEAHGVRCDGCKTPIADATYVGVDDAEAGYKRTYHDRCFFCAQCGDPFLPPGGGEPAPFIVYKGHAYCAKCDISMRAPKCCKCRKPIANAVLKAMGKQWHELCFTCEGCGRAFASSSFYVRDDRPYCDLCQRDHLSRSI